MNDNFFSTSQNSRQERETFGVLIKRDENRSRTIFSRNSRICDKWQKVMIDGEKWREMVRNGEKWREMVINGKK
jgi:hypothetical protein